jgi:hypothetical protein
VVVSGFMGIGFGLGKGIARPVWKPVRSPPREARPAGRKGSGGLVAPQGEVEEVLGEIGGTGGLGGLLKSGDLLGAEHVGEIEGDLGLGFGGLSWSVFRHGGCCVAA